MLKRICHINLNYFLRKSSTSTIDHTEINHFKKFTEEWWDELGKLKPLHTMNKIRVPFVCDGLANAGTITQRQRKGPQPLINMEILDVGCGGGIMTEPLARLGGTMTGLDGNGDIIEKAKHHSIKEKLTNIQYVCSSIEEYADSNCEKHDVIVASEVLEHVSQKENFLKACINCLKPGGSIFITTINKTEIAKFAGILLAENLLKLLPEGTHDHEKFIQPHHLQRILHEENCKTILIHGMWYNFITNEWVWSSNNHINYALHAVKLQKEQ